MIPRLAIQLVILSLFLISCSFPGGENTQQVVTSTSETIVESNTPTAHPEVTIEITQTNTPVQVATPIPTNTPALPVEPSPTPFPEVWYIIQPGTPLATYNTPHEAAGCSWLGVGGQVFGPDTTPELGLSILVGGTLDGFQVGSLGTTGMETNIGEGGYEVTLADHPVDSSGTLWIQIVDAIGNPLSEKVYFDTINDCERNFILINFVRYTLPLPIDGGWIAHFPIILKQSTVLSTPTP